MKLSVWARQNGIKYQTAWRLFRDGKLPVKAIQLVTGTILVQQEEAVRSGSVAIYARVSGSDQKADLDRQVGRLAVFASMNKLSVDCVVSEIGSGLNGARSKLKVLLSDPSIDTILVEHRERLARFGVEYIESALKATGRKLVVMEDTEINDDLVSDMVDVMTSFCARLYGKRAARNRAEAALRAANNPPKDTTTVVLEKVT